MLGIGPEKGKTREQARQRYSPVLRDIPDPQAGQKMMLSRRSSLLTGSELFKVP